MSRQKKIKKQRFYEGNYQFVINRYSPFQAAYLQYHVPASFPLFTLTSAVGKTKTVSNVEWKEYP